MGLFGGKKKKGKKKKGKKKKGKEDKLKDYEKNYLKRLGIITPDEKNIWSDSPEANKIIAGFEEENKKSREKFQDIHILTREEVEKARAEIEIIKIREPHRQSQKTIPTQATILNAGITLDDCYIIFGIDQHITCDELKKQFRELSVKYNSSIGRLQKTEEENEIMEKVHTRINQAYTQLYETHKCVDR